MDQQIPQVDVEAIVFEDDGIFPNSALPLLVYRRAFAPETADLAAAFEQRLAENGWTNAWRNGVYSYPHYHSTAHEVLAVYRGKATLQLGGPIVGIDIVASAGDVLVIPAGVSHQNLGAHDGFAVVGAYAGGRDWDLLRGDRGDRPGADRNIAAVPVPAHDPLAGVEGPLRHYWLG